jgi:magnesium-transporting ATPase (P-type)
VSVSLGDQDGRLTLGQASVLPPARVLGALGSTRAGLTGPEATRRLALVGPNVLPAPRGPSLARQLVAQLVHFFALMLWGAAALALVGGMPVLAVAIVVVIVVNAVFSFVQEYRAERAVRALSRLLPEAAVVRRDGRKTRIPVADLVPGDVVVLAEGDSISADARVIRAAGLRVDNSLLTGESEPVARVAEPLTGEPPDLVDAGDLVFAGTYVAAGSGIAAVVATAGQTRLGAISRLTSGVVRRPTPLRVQLNRSVRVLAGFAIGVGAVFFAASLALGMPPGDGFLFSVGVIVALVPEGLLPTLTLSLAMSATRMAKRGVLVRRLESVETLGSTTVICTDKTGTLTANEMTARALITRGHVYRIAGSGYDPRGALTVDGRPLDTSQLRRVEPVLRGVSLCNDARVELRDGRWRCIGDPTEGALVVMARKGGVEQEVEERNAPRVREFPFDSVRRRMCTVHALPSGGFDVIVKGSPEAVLEACASFDEEGLPTPMRPEVAASVLLDVERLAGEGLRVLAVARRGADVVPARPADAEQGLELLGLIGMADPVRPEVPEALRRASTAGMRVLMITGDHPATARAVARSAGFDVGNVVLGADLPASDDDLAALLADRSVSVLARVAPEEKLRIARALQSLGEVVAMTGDGVNDAPALRQADIGIAMGVVGTDVAREAADLVLLDDNFAHIVQAVEEGRAAFENIRRFLTYHLTDNVAELTPFVVWALSGGSIPLMITVLQVLALDIGTDLLPALALGSEAAEPGTMQRPPRHRTARLLDRHVLGRAFGFLGPVEAGASMAMLPVGAALFFAWPEVPLPSGGVEKETLSTMVFAAIVCMQMANAFECRSTPASLFAIGPLRNRLLVASVLTEALALAVFIYVPPVADAMGMQPLGRSEWLPILVTPFVLLAAEEARKAGVRARGRAHPRPAVPLG